MNLQGAQSKHSQPDEFYKTLRIINLQHIWQEGFRLTNRSSGVHETLDMLPIKWIDSGDLGCENAKGHHKMVFKYIYIPKALVPDKSTMTNFPFLHLNEILFLTKGIVIGSRLIGHSKSAIMPVMPV